MTNQIQEVEHSGKVWRSLGMTLRGNPIWPIEEMIARCPHLSPEEIEELKALNPDGREEGAAPIIGPVCEAAQKAREPKEPGKLRSLLGL